MIAPSVKTQREREEMLDADFRIMSLQNTIIRSVQYNLSTSG